MSADKKEVASSPGLKPVAGTPKQVFRFVARPPILNHEQQVFGYELLFRDGIENFFRATDINCTRDLLLKDGITFLPSGQTVVEVLEDVEPDDLIIAACQRPKVAGYTIALDDYVSNDHERQ